MCVIEITDITVTNGVSIAGSPVEGEYILQSTLGVGNSGDVTWPGSTTFTTALPPAAFTPDITVQGDYFLRVRVEAEIGTNDSNWSVTSFTVAGTCNNLIAFTMSSPGVNFINVCAQTADTQFWHDGVAAEPDGLNDKVYTADNVLSVFNGGGSYYKMLSGFTIQVTTLGQSASKSNECP